jgi:hypothetical protein
MAVDAASWIVLMHVGRVVGVIRVILGVCTAATASRVNLVVDVMSAHLDHLLSAYDHTSTNAPETIRTRKLNVLGPV